MAGVTFSQVTKRFGDVTAVDELTLDIVDGELMVLLGPSGCGKSTALRMVAGLEELNEGTLRIGDRVVNDIDPADRNVSMVFQSYALYPHMSVARNIESPLLVRTYPEDGADQPWRKLTKAERADRVAEAARVLGLSDYLDRKPAKLSGGQRQRVALARAFVARPYAFLMDEPLSNLDAKLRAQTRIELVDLHRRVATTVIYVTHDQIEAMTMADRIAVMRGGRIQQVGTPSDVYEDPANQFVAEFVGTPPMNTLTGTWSDRGVISVDEARLPAPPDLATPGDVGGKVVVGARPEHFRLDDEGGVPAVVRAVEWLGHECLIFLNIGDQPLVVRQPGSVSAEIGSVIRLAVEPGSVYCFDIDTGDRLR